MLYIDYIANTGMVTNIINRIQNVNVDGIFESGELEAFISNGKFSLFPQTGIVERSDMACGGLLEGKVIVLIEGSGLGLIAPKTFREFISASADNYENVYFGVFMKLLRTLSLFFSISLSAFYICIISFHNDMLPSEYIITIANLHANVPFNAFTSVMMLEITLEI